jgi:hypothetical protein
MLRPTPKEIIAGLQRAITETMMPELKSPFALSQATVAAMILSEASGWIESFPAHAVAEAEDLIQTFDALRPHGESALLEAAGFREALQGGVQASDEEPPNHHAMENSMGELAGGVATGRIVGPVAGEVRAYIKRHLQRIRALFGNNSPFG